MLNVEIGSKVRSITGLAFLMLVAAFAHANDEDAICTFHLRQINAAGQRENATNKDVLEKANYLERIARMSQWTIQHGGGSSAAETNIINEMNRANQSLNMAKMRDENAQSEFRAAVNGYVSQCPQHFAAINGDMLKLAYLAAHSSDSD